MFVQNSDDASVAPQRSTTGIPPPGSVDNMAPPPPPPPPPLEDATPTKPGMYSNSVMNIEHNLIYIYIYFTQYTKFHSI